MKILSVVCVIFSLFLAGCKTTEEMYFPECTELRDIRLRPQIIDQLNRKEVIDVLRYREFYKKTCAVK